MCVDVRMCVAVLLAGCALQLEHSCSLELGAALVVVLPP